MRHARPIAALICISQIGVPLTATAQSTDCAFWDSRRYTAWSRVTVEEVSACLEAGIPANRMTPRGHPVILAAERGDLEVLEALLVAGGDPDATDDGTTAIATAIRDVNVDAHFRIALLLQAGATLSPTDATELLRRAALWGNGETIDLLVEQGGDPFIRYDTNGLLHYAVQNYMSPDITGHLLAMGLPPDARGSRGDETGVTPIMAAAFGANVDAVSALLAADVNINARSSGGLTPLHWASVVSEGREAQHAKIMGMLIAAGADIDAMNNEGRASIHTAVVRKFTDGIEILLEAGADVTRKDALNMTPWDYAAGVAESPDTDADLRRALWRIHDAQF